MTSCDVNSGSAVVGSGNDTPISVPLSPGQPTFWTVYFYTSTVDIRQFPGFRIGDLGAIYKN